MDVLADIAFERLNHSFESIYAKFRSLKLSLETFTDNIYGEIALPVDLSIVFTLPLSTIASTFGSFASKFLMHLYLPPYMKQIVHQSPY